MLPTINIVVNDPVVAKSNLPQECPNFQICDLFGQWGGKLARVKIEMSF